MHTPTLSAELSSRRIHNTRKSLRITVQGGPVSILGRAQKRARERGESSHSTSGIPLVSNFPFRRLSVEQIHDLFSVYHIQLGTNRQDSFHIISAIQQLERSQFETYIKLLLQKAKDMSRVVVNSSDFDSQGLEADKVSP